MIFDHDQKLSDALARYEAEVNEKTGEPVAYCLSPGEASLMRAVREWDVARRAAKDADFGDGEYLTLVREWCPCYGDGATGPKECGSDGPCELHWRLSGHASALVASVPIPPAEPAPPTATPPKCWVCGGSDRSLTDLDGVAFPCTCVKSDFQPTPRVSPEPWRVSAEKLALLTDRNATHKSLPGSQSTSVRDLLLDLHDARAQRSEAHERLDWLTFKLCGVGHWTYEQVVEKAKRAEAAEREAQALRERLEAKISTHSGSLNLSTRLAQELRDIIASEARK